jgi:hypothetical protein
MAAVILVMSFPVANLQIELKNALHRSSVYVEDLTLPDPHVALQEPPANLRRRESRSVCRTWWQA